MARKREFDPEELLTVTVEIFWRKGYAETSMRDIVSASGVAHAGVYQTFGSKRDLYIKCMERYNQRFGEAVLGQLEKKNSDLADIQAFFKLVSKGIQNGRLTNGCLMGNTVIEFGSDANDVVGIAREFMERMSSAFEGALRRAKKRGQISKDKKPAALAQYLTTNFYGMMTMVRAGTPPASIRKSIRSVVASLD